MTYDNFTDAQLRTKLAYHNERIAIMLTEIIDFQDVVDEFQRSINVRNEFIVEHDKRKALIRNEMRSRNRVDARYGLEGAFDVLDDEPRVTGIQPPPWDETDESQDSIAPPSHPWLDTLEERVE